MIGQLFDTAIGTCGLAWSEAGVRALVLPGPRRQAAPLRRSAGAARLPVAAADALHDAPAAVRQLVTRIQAHLAGDRRDDLRDVSVDLGPGCSPFARRVYGALREVSPGETITYGGLGSRAGVASGAARAVGGAMARNPIPLVVPCHRVVAAAGPGQFSSPGGLQTKLRLLTIEGADLAPFRCAASGALRRRDERLAPVIRRVGAFPLRPRAADELFDVLAAAIVHQQVSMGAGRAIFARLLARFGDAGRLSPPALARAGTADLRQVGVSRQKAGYLADLGRQVDEGTLSLASLALLDDERVVTELTQVKGIGRWTAEMFLIFSLGRPDVLPVDDLGLQQAVRRLYQLRRVDRRRIEQLAAAWVPYRSAATWYLWRALESGGVSA